VPVTSAPRAQRARGRPSGFCSDPGFADADDGAIALVAGTALAGAL
jgi:hypothetical protein